MGRLGHPAALLLWLLLAAAAVPRSAGVPIPLQVTDGGQPPPSTDAADLFPEANAEAEAETEAETEPAAGDASDAGGADSFEPPGNDTGSPRSPSVPNSSARCWRERDKALPVKNCPNVGTLWGGGGSGPPF